MTLFIQANFEKEYRGLQKVIPHMSISNSDKKERFSKKTSRRLFFQYKDREIREHAISKHANIQLSSALKSKRASKLS